MLLCYVVAVISAIYRSLRYAGSLNIHRTEWSRYLKKASALALCYASFSKGCKRQAWLAGEAAFICCAYDVISDWRRFDEDARGEFDRILTALVSDPAAVKITTSVYERERSGALAHDGLERGAAALRCILKVMHCERARESEWGDLDYLGETLQIVDDVLDYEDDLTNGDTNCLRSANARLYLSQLLNVSDARVAHCFGNSSVIGRVIAAAKTKAEHLVLNSEACRDSPISSSHSSRAAS